MKYEIHGISTTEKVESRMYPDGISDDEEYLVLENIGVSWG